MHYRMNLDNLKRLAEKLNGYARYGFYNSVYPATIEWLLVITDGDGAPLIVLDVDAFSYNEECLSLIARMLIARWELKKRVDDTPNKALNNA